MIETIVIPVAIAIVSGIGVMTNRVYGRIMELDKRIDKTELRMAEAYISKETFETVVARLERGMERIEDKLDKLSEPPYRR
jgi:hypothetical protein